MNTIPISQIIVGERFRKKYLHVKELADSIKRFANGRTLEHGLIHPLIINKEKHLVAGGRRLKACELLGMTEVPYIHRDEIDELTLRELEWEENLQRDDLDPTEKADAILQLHKLKQDLYGASSPGSTKGWTVEDTATSLGVTQGSVSQWLTVAAEKAKSPEVAEALKKEGLVAAYKTVQKLREQQVQTILASKVVDRVKATKGDPRRFLMLGDCCDLIKAVPDASVDLVFCDPPYGVGVDDMNYWGAHSRFAEIKYEDGAEQIEALMQRLMPELVRVMKPNSYIAFWCAFSTIADVTRWFEQFKLDVCPLPFHWCKDCQPYTVNADRWLGTSVEYVVYATKGKPILAEKGKPNFQVFAPLPAQARAHPHEKPIPVQCSLIKTFVGSSAVVLDPFAGSGSLVKAALLAKCKPLGFEKDPVYHARALLGMEHFL